MDITPTRSDFVPSSRQPNLHNLNYISFIALISLNSIRLPFHSTITSMTSPEEHRHLLNIIESQHVVSLERGKTAKVTTVTFPPTSRISLVWDEALTEHGIKTEPGSLLIDQKATATLIGRPAGIHPSTAMTEYENSYVFPGNHFGWQYGAYFINDGHLIGLPDDPTNRILNFLIRNQQGEWDDRHLELRNGSLARETDISDIAHGLSGPFIVRNGEEQPVRELLSNPRLLADPRNVLDFSNTNQFNFVNAEEKREFWQLIRKALPYNPSLLSWLWDREIPVEYNLQSISDVEYAKLRYLIAKSRMDHLTLDRDDEQILMEISRTLPYQRMPLMAIGINKDNSWFVIAADGRSSDSAGLTITELAQQCVLKGAYHAILTAGGGDVFIGNKTKGKFKTVNSPSNQLRPYPLWIKVY